MTNHPNRSTRFTMADIARVYWLYGDDWRTPARVTFATMRDTLSDLSALSRLALRVERINERGCNEGSSDALDAQADKLVGNANAIAEKYNATFYRYGEGSGLWPHVKLHDGRTFTP